MLSLLLFCTLHTFSSSADGLCVCNALIRCAAASGDAVLFVCTRIVCTKNTGFLFVKIRRETRTRYEDFCEEERERYVAFGDSETEPSGEVRREPSIQACFKKRNVVVPWPALQSWPCSFSPSPFSLAHTAICAREVKPNLDRMFSMCFSIVR